MKSWRVVATGLAMAVGSTHAKALENPRMAETFTIARKMNPEGIKYSNLCGAYQSEKALEAVELLEAQALQIHVQLLLKKIGSILKEIVNL